MTTLRKAIGTPETNDSYIRFRCPENIKLLAERQAGKEGVSSYLRNLIIRDMVDRAGGLDRQPRL